MRLCLSIWVVCFGLTLRAQNPDINLLKSIHVDRNQTMDPFMEGISKTEYAIGIGIPVSLCAAAWIKRDHQLLKKGVNMSLAMVLNTALTFSLKRIVNRDRPGQRYSFIEPLENERYHSFPSGHTSNAFVVATSMSLNFKKWYVIVPAYSWAALVGYSRLHLGVHYPSDVLAGALLGAGSAVVTYKVNQWFHKKYEKRFVASWL